MKKFLVLALAVGISASALAVPMETNGHWVHAYPAKSQAPSNGATTNSNISYHGGDVLYAARVVPIFWGSYWTGTGASEASTMVSFYNQFGTGKHYVNTSPQMLNQYYDTVTGSTRFIGGSTLTQLSGDAWYDTSNPSSKKVTDAMVQSEVKKYLAGHGYKALDANGVDQTIYEVFIPPTYYSNSGGSSSCGGPHLAYCAYHGSFTDSNSRSVKYSIEPYPSCSGCSASGFTTLQNAQHFACHETREAVTDPENAWWNSSTGYEADDQCAWSPAPFLDGSYGYQYEWSNATGSCIKP